MKKASVSIFLVSLFFVSIFSTFFISIYNQDNQENNYQSQLFDQVSISKTADNHDYSILKTSAVGSMFYDSMMTVNRDVICILGNSGKVHCDSDGGFNVEVWEDEPPFSGVLPLQGRIKSIASAPDSRHLGCGLFYDGNVSCWRFQGTVPSWFGENDSNGIYNLNLSKQVVNFAMSSQMICYVLVNGTGECTDNYGNNPKITSKKIKQLVVTTSKVCIVTWESDVYCDNMPGNDPEENLFDMNGYEDLGQGNLISASGGELCVADSVGNSMPGDTTCTPGGGYGGGVVLGMTNGGTHSHPETNHCYIQSNGYLICEIHAGEINYDQGPGATSVQGDGRRICIINLEDELKCWVVDSDREYIESTPSYFSESNFVLDGPSGTIADMDADGVLDIYDSSFSQDTKKQQIDSGYKHTCVIDTGENIQCWGENSHGQLGLGHNGQVQVPTLIQSSQKYQSVSAGFAHTCAITTSNYLQCWGSNIDGQLGINSASDVHNPTDVMLDGSRFQVIAVDTGGNHTCALNLSNSMFCWGSNSYGQLGIGSTTDSSIPQTISSSPHNLRPKDIATGDAHTCAVDEDWYLYCWGDNQFGQLPHWQSSGSSSETSPMYSGYGTTRVIAGEHHTCVWGNNGGEISGSPWSAEMSSGVLCAGANGFGQLGDGTTMDRSNFVTVERQNGNQINSGVSIAVAGWNHNCILIYSENVLCWGSNSSGQIGWSDYSDLVNGQPAKSSYYANPFNIGVLTNSMSISAGGNHSCIVDLEGLIACVGDNSKQQLGRNHSILSDSQYPNIVLSDEFHSILIADDLSPGTMSSSTQSTCYLNSSQTVNCFMSHLDRSIFASSDTSRQIVKFPEFGSDSTSVQTTEGLVCTIDQNQTASCIGNIWRRENYWNVLVFEDEERNTSLPTGITKLAVGKQTACAILQNGTIICEGRYHGSNLNTFSYPAYPENLSQHGKAIDLAVWDSPYSSPSGATFCGVFENSKIACWGSDFWHLSGRGGPSSSNNYQNNLPEVTADLPTNFVPRSIHESSDGFCVISTDERVACWGNPLQYYNGSSTSVPTLFPIQPNSTGSLNEFSARKGTACALYSSGEFYCLNSTYSWTYISSNVINHTARKSGICYNSNQSELHCLVGTDSFGRRPGSGLITVQRGETTLADDLNVIEFTNTDEDLDGFVEDDYPSDPTRSVECPEGQTGRYQCKDIPPGYYSDKEVSDLPLRCLPGTYQPILGSLDCDDAEPGNYSNGYGNEDTEMCPKGSFEPNYGSAQCDLAAPGNFSSKVGSTSQEQCGLGTYQPEAGQDTCIDSAPGYYVDSVGAKDQSACPAGSYLRDSQSDSVEDCTDTPPGAYSKAGASEPIYCTPGMYQPLHSADHCLYANPGFYVPSVGESTQYPCVPGSYTSSIGRSVCSQTAPGYFVNISEATQQFPCEPGTYQENSNSTECTSTSPGNYSTTSGSASQNPCNPGTYAPFSGMEDCIDSGHGFYVPQQGSSTKIQCPIGQSTSIEQSQTMEDCVDAAAGNFVDPDGGPETKCLNGSYQPLTGQSSCLDADVGFFVSSEGMTSQMPCISGTYQPERGQAECLDAEIGYYVEGAGATVQLPCPDGFLTKSTGSTSILQCNVELSGEIDDDFSEHGSEKEGIASDSSFVSVAVPLSVIFAVVGLIVFRKIRSRNEEMAEDEIQAIEEYEQRTQTPNRELEDEVENQSSNDTGNSSDEYVVDEDGTSWYQDGDGVWWYWNDELDEWLQHK